MTAGLLGPTLKLQPHTQFFLFFILIHLLSIHWVIPAHAPTGATLNLGYGDSALTSGAA